MKEKVSWGGCGLWLGKVVNTEIREKELKEKKKEKNVDRTDHRGKRKKKERRNR